MKPHLRWRFAIVGLLGGNVLAMVILAITANNGGTQVIPGYYAKAARYDDEMARSVVSQALGWHAEVAMTRGTIDVTVADAAGHAIDGAQIRVTGYQRAHASEPIDVVLLAVGPGRYRAGVRERRGWHDLVVVADRGGAHYTQHVVVEAR
jgi:nitrogen fixation protein FixH